MTTEVPAVDTTLVTTPTTVRAGPSSIGHLRPKMRELEEWLGGDDDTTAGPSMAPFHPEVFRSYVLVVTAILVLYCNMLKF